MASSDIGKLSTAAPVAAFVVTGMVTTVFGPILPELLESWHLSDSAAGALFTAQFSGSLTAGALSGLLVSRIGDRRTLALGYATMCAGLLAISAGAHAAGVAGAFAAGVGMGCVIPPTNLLVARGRPDRAASALGVLNLSWGIGAAAWPLVVSAALRLGAMRPALVGLALLCAAASLAVLAFVRGPDAVATDPRLAAPVTMARVGLFGVLIWLYSGTEMALGGWLPELARRLPSARAGRITTGVVEGLQRYAPERRMLAEVLAASIAVQVLRVLQAYCLGRSLGITMPATAYFAFVPIILLVMLLPISVNGLGTSQIAFVGLFGRAGVAQGPAFALSVLFLALGVIGNLPGGILYAMGRRKGTLPP